MCVSTWPQWVNLPIFFRVSSLALGKSYDWPSASEVTLKNMGKINHNKAWIMCIIHGIYLIKFIGFLTVMFSNDIKHAAYFEAKVCNKCVIIIWVIMLGNYLLSNICMVVYVEIHSLLIVLCYRDFDEDECNGSFAMRNVIHYQGSPLRPWQQKIAVFRG